MELHLLPQARQLQVVHELGVVPADPAGGNSLNMLNVLLVGRRRSNPWTRKMNLYSSRAHENAARDGLGET